MYAFNNLTELRGAEFSGTVWLDNRVRQQEWSQGQLEQTLDASAVNPAEFSLVWRPLCGPGSGFCPFENASSIFFVVSAVRSSYGGGGAIRNEHMFHPDKSRT